MVLRYFNAAGADPDGILGEHHDPEVHLIPRAIDAILGGEPLAITLEWVRILAFYDVVVATGGYVLFGPLVSD